MKNAGKARSYGLYRHLRTSKEIIENLLNYYVTNLILNCLIGCRNKICRNRHLQKAKERKKT